MRDFYAPYKMPNGRIIYGAAALSRRLADAGGMNRLSFNFVLAGIEIGYYNSQQKLFKKN